MKQLYCTYRPFLRIAFLLFVQFLFFKSISSQEKPEKLTPDSLTAIAKSFINESVDSVLKYALPAISKAEKSGKFDIVIKNHLNLYKAYYQNNKMDSALCYAEKANSFANKTQNKEILSSVFHSLGIIFYKTGELDSALYYYKKKFEIEKESGNKKNEASALGNIGMVYYRLSEYKKAIDYYFKCLEISRSIGDNHKVMLTYNNIGNVYRYLEDYQKALAYYRKAVEITDPVKDKRFLGFMNNNLAIVFRKQQKYDSAIIFYNKAKETYQKINYQKGIASALTGLAITYNKKDDLDKSYKTYLEAIRIQKKVNDRIGLASNYGNLAILLLDKGQPAKAIEYLIKSDSLALKTGYRELQKNNYETFRDAYSMLGNYKKALEYELKFIALKDSIYDIEKLKEIEDVQEKYQAEQKQHKIDILNEQARVKDIKLSRKNIVIIFLAIIILLAFMIGWLINHNNKTKAKKNLIILENKLLRTQMNPHFMFNSLNAIQTYILKKNPLEGASYLAKFAELMRAFLYNSRREFIPLEKEIKMIRNYLELQQIRFNSKFSYSLEIDDNIDTENVYIPPMLLQPFIENAIEHGFKDIDYQGKLIISFILQKENILVKIKDNGIGIKTSKQRNTERKKLHDSLATVISKERLDLFNKRIKKELFSLDIKQTEDDTGKVTGTEVKLLIPYRTG